MTRSGDKYEGIYAGSNIASGNVKVSLKMTKKVHNASAQTNGFVAREAALVGSSPEHIMNFDMRDVVDVSISSFVPVEAAKTTNGGSDHAMPVSVLTRAGTTASFQTDVDISGNTSRGERPLQRWVPDAPNDADFSLESGAGGAGWDQFATNNQLFGAESTYDENLYTTTIDRSDPAYKIREAEAARIAREIEGATSTNAHVREERGQVLENEGEDEEEKYSGVRRDDRSFPSLPVGGANKYTPPALRPPTAQPTVLGVPVDPAIISAQLSRPDSTKTLPSRPLKQEKAKPSTEPQQESTTPKLDASTDGQVGPDVLTNSEDKASLGDAPVQSGKSISVNTTPAMLQKDAQNPTANVEVNVLNHFRQFAQQEKNKLAERKRVQAVQASQDRTAKLNDLLRFSKSFKLKTPIPTDLVGILAKDPKKQEAIIEKAREESASTTASPSAASPGLSRPTAAGRFDASMIPSPIPDRQAFNRGRGGFPQAGVRNDRANQPQQPMAARTVLPSQAQRPVVAGQERQPSQTYPIPAPIPLPEGRLPPSGPAADQSGITSPQRSNLHTPTSAVSSKFNVKASEFRPNANAPTFNPVGVSNAPSSPASVSRAGSIARATSPSAFFGSRKPKPASERPSISVDFNPIKRMQQEVLAHNAGDQNTKGEESQKDKKGYSFNGGIPNAYHTGPRWLVTKENEERTYASAFDRPIMPGTTSPVQARSGSTQHVPYQHQLPHLQNGMANIPQISTPHHTPQAGPHHYPHHYEDGQQQHRMHMPMGSPQVYPSPSVASRQISTYASPMAHPAQLAYGQSPYFGAPAGQMPMQMRQYSGTPGMMHAQPGQLTAPMMVQQQSSGPYMAVPQQFNHQMSMYSPSPGHVYPQQNGYPSPGRVAPMMMQQGSQQGHHPGQPVMYAMPGQAQPGQMMYPQQGQMGMMRGGYAPQHGPYGGSPHHLQQRAMSSGYGQIPQKVMPQAMQQAGPPPNAPQQPAAYATQMDSGVEEGK